MIVIISYIILISVFRVILPKMRKSYIFISGFLIFLISALRSVYFGPDPIGYVNRYLSLKYISVSEAWLDLFSGLSKDPMFYFISKIISLCGANYQVWLAIISGVFCFSVCRLIYKYSDEPYISFIAIISLGYFYFSLTGLRQTVAIAIILISYRYMREKKVVPFILLVLIASLFHSSALIFLISYPLAYMKIGWKQIAGIIIALGGAIFLKNQIRVIVRIIGWTETLSSYADREMSLSFSGFAIQILIYFFCLYYKKGTLKADNKNLSLYNLLFIGVVFQTFSVVIAEFFRVSMYFSIFSIILIPNSIKVEHNKKLRVIVYCFVIISLIAYIFWTRGFSDFQFFWQG